MPTPVVAGAIWQYRVNYTMFGQRFISTMNLVRSATSPVVTDYNATANAFLAWQTGLTGFIPKLQACLSNQVTFVTHELQPIYPTRLRSQLNILPGTAGTQAGLALPTNTAQTITKTTDLATRYGIGSMHLPPGDINSVSVGTGQWTIVQFGLLNTVALHIVGPWLSVVLADVWEPVLWNQATPARVTPITSAKVQETIRVERRRTVGLGI